MAAATHVPSGPPGRRGFRIPLSMRIQIPVCIIMVLLVAACGFVSYRDATQAMRAKIEESSLAAAGAVARAMETFMDRRRSDIDRIANDPDVASFSRKWLASPRGVADEAATERRAADAKALADKLAAQLRKSVAIDRISILDANGVTVSSTTASAVGSKFGDRDYFKAAIAGKLNTSRPILSRVSGKAVIIAAAPIVLDGKVVGVAYTSGSLEALLALEMKPFGRTGVQFATGMDGRIVIHQNPEHLFKDLPVTPVFKGMLAAPPSGVAEYADARGVPVFAAYVVAPSLGMMFVLQSEVEEVLAAVVAIRDAIFGTTACAAVVGFLAVWLLLRPMLSALRAGIGYARDIASGKLDGDLAVGRGDEIGDLANAMRSIPATVKNIMSAADAAAMAIGRGDLGRRLDVEAFPGAFSHLAECVNTIAGAYGGIIDKFPPLVSCDADRHILYVNKAAADILGEDPSGKKDVVCGDRFRTPICGTAGCLGNACMRDGRPCFGETAVDRGKKAIDVAITAVPSTGPDGRVCGFFEFLQDIGPIKRQQRTTDVIVGRALDISGTMAEFAGELDAKVLDVARAAEEQRGRVEASASAMVDMNASIAEVARNASRASERCGQSRDKAAEGAEVVKQVVDAVRSVDDLTSSLKADMERLGRQAEEIGSVIAVIRDIADQTNLLALNAAIEAARAGEAGRGFAVVADEVRKLAEKTTTSTAEVGASIGAIQETVKSNIDAVARAAGHVNEATALAGRSGAVLREIVEISAASAEDVASIASAAEQQGSSADEMAHSLEEIRTLVVGTTEGVSAAAKGVESLKGTAEELRGIVESSRTVAA
jgi:methyl-accepting chemotaxis protein